MQSRLYTDQHEHNTEAPSLDVGALYSQYRNYAFSIAYRMLGSVTEAEDLVQDIFMTLQSMSNQDIKQPKTYIGKMIVNRSLNVLNSARNQREHYVGEWLPEPLGVYETKNIPEQALEQKEMISYAYLVMLERLSPTERAVFVLREAFQYDYAEIAEWLGKTESNCRQIYRRARGHLPEHAAAAESYNADWKMKEHLLGRFTMAFLRHDVSAMLELLTDEPVFTADGGGVVRTIMRTMSVHKGVLAILTSPRVLKTLREREWLPAWINGELQLALMKEDKLTEVLCLETDASGERIKGIYLIVNPDKLLSVKAQA
ncbi:sigma-70 family RNA polymerase sigma factor [Paenibacillus silvae]|uniref:sigma-70 family RNA polymerase sigma factor n=1 Tax=Paenibacillus silvae TaxID=1325358 RepID=UPI0020059303|nr:sigma-70 family RNA polymerase sigma factor [Paenibacillus silvae]MCK6150920.1 sigma-70 family RNA polymerase sigma factor [Paenibacillus silvae]MCK6269180.1 sigma-70 family RNA polymerase sigma factor [Paenibacillus silvae]